MQRIQKKIREFLPDRAPPALASDATAAQAGEVMKERKASCVLVVDDGALVGIFTERDYLNRVAAAGLKPADTPLGEVMTADPETLGPDDCISYAINCMATGGFRNVPIIDDSGKPLGTVAVRDVISHLERVFEDVEDGGEDDMKEWVDIGGG